MSNNQLSVVQIADILVKTAIEKKASDIHLETFEHNLRVRLRLDGVLHDHMTVEHEQAAQLLSRFKVMAHINIAEKRIPQDGKFNVLHNNAAIDFRVSTFPAYYGEKMVIRVLDRTAHAISLDALGMETSMLASFGDLLFRSSGFILVTGPTGSGKTTTLYAALSALNSIEKNIITLEDPIEYSVHGVTQGQINNEIGFTFAKGIRAMLRQDPDIFMIGEIRDKETAQIAIQASLTGHVVLSTVHTNDAPSVIMRLMDMGIEPFLINAALNGVLAQRLARKICTSCKKQVVPSDRDKQYMKRIGLQLDTLYEGAGCQDCSFLGYKGRIGIFELLIMTPALRSLIVRKPHFDAIYEQALKDGMHTLCFDGLQKVQKGIISLAELVRSIA